MATPKGKVWHAFVGNPANAPKRVCVAEQPKPQDWCHPTRKQALEVLKAELSHRQRRAREALDEANRLCAEVDALLEGSVR
jgi:hypothetical protein